MIPNPIPNRLPDRIPEDVVDPVETTEVMAIVDIPERSTDDVLIPVPVLVLPLHQGDVIITCQHLYACINSRSSSRGRKDRSQHSSEDEHMSTSPARAEDKEKASPKEEKEVDAV